MLTNHRYTNRSYLGLAFSVVLGACVAAAVPFVGDASPALDPGRFDTGYNPCAARQLVVHGDCIAGSTAGAGVTRT